MASPETRIEQFMRRRLQLAAVPLVPEVRLYMPHEGSGLSRFLGTHAPPPYWAYPWAGGIAIARYVLDHPETVAGRRVLDFGAGSGLVAIAAAKAGARLVLAADIDPIAIPAMRVNAEANGVDVEPLLVEETLGPLPTAEIVLAGDVFYADAPAAAAAAFLNRCKATGMDVLVGDPGRANLPRPGLRTLATYRVRDFGAGRSEGEVDSHVFMVE